MSTEEKYIVKNRDTLSNIAKQYKINDWKKLWNHKANRDINRKCRGDETKICAKDVLTIPAELSPKVDQGKLTLQIGKMTHQFKDEIERDIFLKTVKVLNIDGKKHVFVGKEWDEFQKEMLRQIKRTVLDMARQRVNPAEGLWHHYDQMNDDQLIVSWFVSLGGPKQPPVSLIVKAKQALANLEAAVNSGDFKRIHRSMADAQGPINEAYDTMKRYQKEVTGRAENWLTGLKWTKGTAFFLVGLMATPVVVTAAGSAVLGGAIVSGGTALISSTSNELGHGIVGTSDGVGKALRNISLATLIDGSVGAFMKSNKAKEIMEKAGATLAKTVTSKWLSKVPSTTVQKFVTGYFENAGSSFVESGIKETAKLAKGETTKDEFLKNIAKSTAIGGILKDFEKVFDAKFAQAVYEQLPKQFRDKFFEKVSPEQAVKFIEKAMNTTASKTAENAVNETIASLTGKDNMQKAATDAATKAAAKLVTQREFLERLKAAAEAQ